jgi:hypothetical protein
VGTLQLWEGVKSILIYVFVFPVEDKANIPARDYDDYTRFVNDSNLEKK